jgi:hypothetical protein
MSKLTRQTMILFAGTSDSSSIGVFGSIAPGGGGATYSKVIATVQSLNAWGSGWKAEVVSPLRPAIQDFNAVDYVFSYGICYLHEMGIPEWDAGTVYYQDSYCQVAGITYYSLQDNNLNKNPTTQTSYWTTGIKGVGSVPSGGIILWYGSIVTIPSGWYLCDGNNGTPDLRNQFVIGAGSGYAVGATGGESTHTLTTPEIPGHIHGIFASYDDGTGTGGAQWSIQPWHDSTVGISLNNGAGYQACGSTGGDAAHNNMPPYYALAYIMKS